MMESMQYAEAVVKEFLLFRGFTRSVQAFDADLEADLGQGFQVERILDLIFTVYIPRFEADNLIKLLAFLQQTFFSMADTRYHNSIRKLEMSLKKYYIVNAVQKGRIDQVLQFFERHGDALLHSGSADEWLTWFALPYMKNPSADPRYQLFFSKEWVDTLIVSYHNLFSQVFGEIRLPVLLTLHSERLKSKALKQDVEKLQTECQELQTIIQAKEDEISKLKSDLQSAKGKNVADGEDNSKMSFIPSTPSSPPSINEGNRLPTVSPSLVGQTVPETDQGQVSDSRNEDMSANQTEETLLVAAEATHEGGVSTGDAATIWFREDEIPHVVVESQVGWKHSLAILLQSHDADFLLLDQMLQVLQLMGQSGSGLQMPQRQHPGMLQYTVELRSWPWSGRTNLTVCCF